MSVISTITVELTAAQVRQVVHAKQYDDMTRYVQIGLTYDGIAYTVPEGTTGMIEIAKPDGTFAVYDQTEGGDSAITISGSTVTILLTQQALAAPGIARAQIDLFGTGGAKLTTMTFDIDVHPSTVPEGAVSEDYYNVLNERVAAAEEAQAAAEDAQAAAEQAASDAADSAAAAATSVTGAVKANEDQTAIFTAAEKAQARVNIGIKADQILNTTAITETAASFDCAWDSYDWISIAPGIGAVPTAGLVVPKSFFAATVSGIYISLPVFTAAGTYAFAVRLYQNGSGKIIAYLSNSTANTPRLRIWGFNG